MKKFAVILGCQGMGDIFCGIPTIKFLFHLYDEPVHVYTHSPELLKNYPYINVHHIDEMNTIDTNKYSVIHTFNTKNFAHNRMDIRQFHAVNIGIQLTPSEMETEFFADEYKPVDLPNQFVAIHPVKTWPSRTWEKERWQELVDRLADVNIPVVAVGKESQEIGSYNTKKPTYKLNIKNGLDLLNKTDIHQTWHILNKSDITITTNSGILIIAGMTDTHIIEIGGSFDPYFRSPYRKGTQDYKHSFILGECKLFCATDSKYSVKYNSLPQKMAPVTYCLENPQTFGTRDIPDPDIYKCHPTTDQIYNEVIKVFKRKTSNSNEGKNYFMIAPKKLKSVQNHLKTVIDRSIESNEEDILGFKKWIKILQTEPRKAIRRLKRKTKQKYKFLEKEMNKELECFEKTGIASENLKKFQEEKIASANKSINTTKIRIRRDRRRLKMVENNLSNLLKEMDRTHLIKNIEAELICYERKFKMQKLIKKSK